MAIIAGLGNPGRDYDQTRHNAGWMALDELAGRCGAGRQQYRCDGVCARCGGLLLFKPLLYMNRSGPPVARLMREEGADLTELLVLVDDVNLPLGAIRLRAAGSSGAHNGLESLIEALGTEEFARLRMGIGPCPPGIDLRDFVLSPFQDGQWPDMDDMVARAADAVLCWAQQGVEAAMDRFNGTGRPCSSTGDQQSPAKK